MNRFALLLLVLPVALACGRDTPATQAQNACGTPASSETVRVMQGLKPHCEGCHAQGARGYFASVDRKSVV